MLAIGSWCETSIAFWLMKTVILVIFQPNPANKIASEPNECFWHLIHYEKWIQDTQINLELTGFVVWATGSYPLNLLCEKNDSKIWVLEKMTLNWVDLVKKKGLPDLWGSVKNFLGIQHQWCGYLKHSPRSRLSNARCLMSVQHTQTKRYGVFWFTGVWKHFYSLKKQFSAYCYGKSTKITKMWFLQVFWSSKRVEYIPNMILSCSKHLRNI